jgi:hypothetical protein
MEGYETCTRITYPFVSVPMRGHNFVKNLRDQAVSLGAIEVPLAVGWNPGFTNELPDWAIRQVDDAGDVFQVGPWRVDVRQKVEGEVKVYSNGPKELERYVHMARCFRTAADTTDVDSSIYARKLAEITEVIPPEFKRRKITGDGCGCHSKFDEFGWGCMMSVIRLPQGGCLLYSPVLDENQNLERVHAVLKEKELLPVKYILAPTPQHHLCLKEYRTAFPDAFFMCGRASGIMQPLYKKRRDLDFDCVLYPIRDASQVREGETAVEWKPATTNPGPLAGRIAEFREELTGVIDVHIVDDNRTGEVTLIHRPSGTLVVSDLLYKSSNAAELKGPGGDKHRFSFPKWFAEGQEELFYKLPSDNSNGLLPAYRTHPMYRKIDLASCKKSIDVILQSCKAREVKRCVTCHTDPIESLETIERTMRLAWNFL